jgi:hypothetical protein
LKNDRLAECMALIREILARVMPELQS